MSDDFPLYPSEAQIARKVFGQGRADEWKGLVVVLEREGFPPIQPRYGGRFWPACERWFRIKNGLDSVTGGQLGKEDGVETCPQPRKNKRRDSSGESVATVHKFPTGSRTETT